MLSASVFHETNLSHIVAKFGRESVKTLNLPNYISRKQCGYVSFELLQAKSYDFYC